jgi:prevent-host-death family protein
MRTVTITELKNRLSTYITYAKAGETIIIRDRNTPVAKLIPIPTSTQDDGLDEETRQLIADGILAPAKRPWNPAALDRLPWPKVEGRSATQALLDEREEGR